MTCTIRILSIDPGTNHTGVSILDVSKDGIEVIFAETINAVKLARQHESITWVYGSRFARIRVTGDRISHLLDEYEPNMVITELPYMGRFAQSFGALTELVAEFKSRVYCYDPSMPLDGIDPSSVKKHMGVKGTSNDKDEMTVALEKRCLSYSKYINPSNLDEHAIDSICVGLWLADVLF